MPEHCSTCVTSRSTKLLHLTWLLLFDKSNPLEGRPSCGWSLGLPPYSTKMSVLRISESRISLISIMVAGVKPVELSGTVKSHLVKSHLVKTIDDIGGYGTEHLAPNPYNEDEVDSKKPWRRSIAPPEKAWQYTPDVDEKYSR